MMSSSSSDLLLQQRFLFLRQRLNPRPHFLPRGQKPLFLHTFFLFFFLHGSYLICPLQSYIWISPGRLPIIATTEVSYEYVESFVSQRMISTYHVYQYSACMTETYPLPPRHTQGPASLHRNHPRIDRRSSLQKRRKDSIRHSNQSRHDESP